MKNNKSSIYILNKIINVIIKENLIIANKNILLAFSSGQDSICLVLLLLQYSNQFNINIGLTYFNHLWNLSNLYKTSHVLKTSFYIQKIAFFSISTQKIFTEKNSRIWRYSALLRISQFYHYDTILTGHTLTDQIETLLLNLFRGSGKKGVITLFNNHLLINKSTKRIFLSKANLNV